MAVTLVLEDGTGIVNANSYVSISEATEVLELNPTAYATWNAWTPGEQALHLVWATRYLDNFVDWYGFKTKNVSALRWPRTGVIDKDSLPIPEDVIPAILKQATAEMAVFLKSSQAAATNGSSGNVPEGIKRVKADVVEVEFFEGAAEVANTKSDMFPEGIKRLLRNLGKFTSGRSRYVKAIR